MNYFVALYRGINVGGNNSVKMEALRGLHARLGHGEVKSYVQSGNIVFSARGSLTSLTSKLMAEFESEFGFATKLLLVEGQRWATILAENPYADMATDNPKLVHAGICAGAPSETGLKALITKTGGTESFVIKGDVVYMHAPDGIGNSKFAAGMEKASGVSMTARNWRTMEAIGELLKTQPASK